MIFSGREDRVQVQTVESQLLNVIQVLTDSLYGSAKPGSADPDAVLPDVLSLFSVLQASFFPLAKAVRENIVYHRLFKPCRHIGYFLSQNKRILIIPASAVDHLIVQLNIR